MAAETETEYSALLGRRRKRFAALVEVRGGGTQVAQLLGWSKSYVTQLTRGGRDINERTARHIEERLGAAPGWLDQSASAVAEKQAAHDEMSSLYAQAFFVLNEVLNEERVPSSRRQTEKLENIVTVAVAHALTRGSSTIDKGYVRTLIHILK